MEEDLKQGSLMASAHEKLWRAYLCKSLRLIPQGFTAERWILPKVSSYTSAQKVHGKMSVVGRYSIR